MLPLLALRNENHQGMADRIAYYRYDNGNDYGRNGGFGTNGGGGYPMTVSYDQYGGLRLGGYVHLCVHGMLLCSSTDVTREICAGSP